MKKLLVLSAAILISCQLLVGQTSQQPELSTWLKTEYVANISYKRDNVSDYSANIGRVAKTKKQKQAPWKITMVAISATVLEAAGDGLYDRGKVEGNQNYIMTGKVFQAVSLAEHFLYIPIMKDSNTSWLWVPFIETMWRFVFFDLTYNLIRGLPVGYVGNTSIWDKGIQSFAPPAGMRLFADGIVATFVITLTYDKF